MYSAPPAARFRLASAQVGKSFRNEITPGNFTFRTREFEQMELEFFCKPGTDLEWFQYWKDYLQELPAQPRASRKKTCVCATMSRRSCPITPTLPPTLSSCSRSAGASCGASQTAPTYDLTPASEAPPASILEYFDQETGEKYIPYVIEPSLGADRVALAFLCDAYDEEVVGQDKKGKDDIRVVLRLHPALAPYKAAVLPLSKKLHDKAMPVYEELAKNFMIDYDEAGSIGKRYRREDEIGTPLCITVDFETENRRLCHHPRPRHHGADPSADRRGCRLHRRRSANSNQILLCLKSCPVRRTAFLLHVM